MEKQIYKNKLRLSYKAEGEGEAIVLIHGFLESADIWTNFSKALSKDFLVISVNLPGHGNSDLYEKPYTMCKYAESVSDVMQAEKIDKAFIIGHSMGGYVSLAFLENFPVKINGLCLFHSSPFADSSDKKDARDNLIKEILMGKKEEICDSHSKKVYAEDQIETFKEEIKIASENAKRIDDKAIIASIMTMRDRNDRSELLSKCNVPLLYVLGMKDEFISSKIIEFISMPQKSEILVLENSGHMGFIEEKEKSLYGVKDFYKKFIGS